MLGAGQRRKITVNITDVDVAESVFIPIPEKCEVYKLWGTIEATIDVALIVTLKIATVAVTGGAITFTAAASAAGDVESSLCTAKTALAAGGVLEVVFNGGPTTTCSGTVVVELTRGVT
jgi:hypothetical protein